MSWPAVKPPWKHVKWFTWGSAQTNPWVVPPSLQWSLILPLLDGGANLYALKEKIEALDRVGEWEYLKRSSNPYELVFSQSQDQRIPHSVSSLRPLSRSFFKMVEIMYVMEFFKRNKRATIRSAHVCEGPGGFIEALLYMSGKHGGTVDNSWAMTLKPSKPNIPGWKRAYQFLKKSPMVHIEYGADDTGDILVPANQVAFLEKARGKCTIFTADGGFDFSEHYGTQEEEVFPLLVSSSLIGLQSLVKGGDFILKIFDTELKSTCDLITILTFCFDHWTLYKPALSRPCNAEKYFLGRGCRGIPGWVIKVLTDIRDGYAKGPSCVRSICPSLPTHVMNNINSLKKEYLEQQVAALEYAISNKELWNKEPTVIWKSISEHSVNWCREFQIPIRIDHQPEASHTSLQDVDRPE